MDRKFEPVLSPGTTSTLPPPMAETAVDSSRVLRNTYWLLALSMLPTVAGALAGMQFNFIALFKARVGIGSLPPKIHHNLSGAPAFRPRKTTSSNWSKPIYSRRYLQADRNSMSHAKFGLSQIDNIKTMI